jgi:hypothetical protein
MKQSYLSFDRQLPGPSPHGACVEQVNEVAGLWAVSVVGFLSGQEVCRAPASSIRSVQSSKESYS